MAEPGTDPGAAAGPGAPGPAEESVAPRSGLRQLTAEEFSFADAIGGVRGLVESTAPGLVFVVVYVITRDLQTTLITASALAVLAVLVRLVQRTPVTQAVSGLVGVGVGVVWAWQTGRAEDYFAGGLLANAGYLLAVVVSVLVRWPLVGVVVSLLRGEDMSWRVDRERARERRRYMWATWIIAMVFALRLAVQVPLYLAGEVGALGTAKLAMGLPLFALALWLTWLLVASPAARAEQEGRRPTPPR